MRHQDVGHVSVVLEQVPLADEGLSPERLVEVGQLDRPASGLNYGLGAVGRYFDRHQALDSILHGVIRADSVNDRLVPPLRMHDAENVEVTRGP